MSDTTLAQSLHGFIKEETPEKSMDVLWVLAGLT